jgi:hypothetical protein
VDGPIRGHSPLSHEDGDGNLNHKLEVICKQAADAVKKQLEKIRITDLISRR